MSAWDFAATKFTSDQLASFELAIRVSSSLSILGSLSILFSYAAWKEFRTPLHRPVLFLSLADLLASCAMVLARFPINAGNQGLCTAQGWMIETFLLASVLCGALITTSLLSAVIYKRAATKLSWVDRVGAVLAFIIPAVISTVIQNTGTKGPVFKNAVLWCWIGQEYDIYRLAFLYIPIWFVFAYNLVVYVLVGRALYKAKQHAGDDAQINWVLRNYIEKAFLFSFAVVLTWIWGTVNRIMNMTGTQNYSLYMLHAVFTPLGGALNALLFLWMSTTRRYKRTARAVSMGAGSLARSVEVPSPQDTEFKPIEGVSKMANPPIANYAVHESSNLRIVTMPAQRWAETPEPTFLSTAK